MATVVVSPRAIRNLERLIQTHALPDSTRPRFLRSIEPLGRFPLLGAPLSGRWSSFRFVLGLWRWMIIVYEFDESADRVAIVAVQDGRSVRAVTTVADGEPGPEGPVASAARWETSQSRVSA